MNAFKTYHPVVNLTYFIFVIGFSCFLMHPICLAVSFAFALLYSFLLQQKPAFGAYLLPMMLLTVLINPLFNHQGVTVLAYLPGGNPLTLESVVYGVAAAGMVGSVICWFSCFNVVMTSDKMISLFGRVLPVLSLLFSMILRFVPRFVAQFKLVLNAQRGLGTDPFEGNFIKRAQNGLKVLSATTTWTLENAIDTADSMKARGYGLEGRTAFSVHTFDRRDAVALTLILVLGSYTLVGALLGELTFSYFPFIHGGAGSGYANSVFGAYALLCFYPVVLELFEVRRWSAIKSKM